MEISHNDIDYYGLILSKEELICEQCGKEIHPGDYAYRRYSNPVIHCSDCRIFNKDRWIRNHNSYEDITKASVKKQVEKTLGEWIPKDCPGDFNQGLMELGAVVCVPNGEARCPVCPLKDLCTAFQKQIVGELPVRAPNKERNREKRTVLVIQDGEYTAIRKRKEEGLLAGLYELPNVPGHIKREEALKLVKEFNMEPLHIEKLEPSKHIFSHIEWRMTGYRIRVASIDRQSDNGLIFIKRKMSDMRYAIPSAFRAYVKYMKEEKE